MRLEHLLSGVVLLGDWTARCLATRDLKREDAVFCGCLKEWILVISSKPWGGDEIIHVAEKIERVSGPGL